MNRKWVVLPALALIVGVFAALGPADGRGARPVAAVPAKVKLDPALKVHPLLQYGAQVEPNKRVRVIVQRANDKVDPKALATAAGESTFEDVAFIHTQVMEVKQKTVLALARNPHVRYISPDAPVHSTAIDVDHLKTTYETAVNIPALWNGSAPATGRGVTVAVIDSGLNRYQGDFSGSFICVNVNKVVDCGDGDGNGHGTHVTGIIKGRDSDGRYIGVAPDANIVSIKVGTSDKILPRKSSEADVINALQWVFNNRLTYNIRVVNLSLSGSVSAGYNSSPLNAAVEQLWLNGVVVVASAGNRGAAVDAVWYAPGNDPFVITVGALDNNATATPADDSLAAFSSRGRTLDGYAKPDVVAPGRKIVSTLASSDAKIAKTFPDRVIDDRYIRMSGTSMSAPVVTGVVALLLERYPTLTPNQVKWLLMRTANTYPGQADAAGVIDPVEAYQRAAGGAPGSANQGLTPSRAIDLTTGTVVSTQTYWDQTYRDQTYWDQTYWDQTYWD